MERRCFRKCSMKGIYLLCIVLALIYYIYIYIFIINKTQLQTPTDCFTP